MNRRSFIKSAIIAASAAVAVPFTLPESDRLMLPDTYVKADAEKIATLCGLIHLPKPTAYVDGRLKCAKTRILDLRVDSTLKFVYYDHLSDYVKEAISRPYPNTTHLFELYISPSLGPHNRYVIARII